MDQPDLPHLDAVALGELAATLLGLPARPGWPDPPFLVALPWGDPWRVDDLGFDLEARSLGEDPVTALCRQRAKSEWVAVGVVVDGWTLPPAATAEVDWRSLRRNGPSLSRHAQRRRVRTLHLVGRGGPVALALLGERATEPEVHTAQDGGAPASPTGPLPDALRRLLGLCTPPCPVPAIELWASLWLAAVAARAGRRQAALDWNAVAALHPGAQLLGQVPQVSAAADLVPIGRILANARGWGFLQRVAAVGDGRHAGFLPAPDVAAWADAGMFARLVLRRVEPLWAAHHDLAGRLDPATLAQVDATLTAWDLDPAPPGTVRPGASCGPQPEHAA